NRPGPRVPSCKVATRRPATSNKISIRVETFGRSEMELYATWCGRALALSHARSGVAAQLSGYVGKSDAFDDGLASFSRPYADQNERDHASRKRAIRAGKVGAAAEEEDG